MTNSTTKVESPMKQSLMVAAICLNAFWIGCDQDKQVGVPWMQSSFLICQRASAQTACDSSFAVRHRSDMMMEEQKEY